MTKESYPYPVDKFLTLGECVRGINWIDYLGFGFDITHIPDLIRMALDDELNNAGRESALVWAPVHAWRTLAQLHAEEAVTPLTQLFRRFGDYGDDWVAEDMPHVFGMIGEAAVPALKSYLSDINNGVSPRIVAAHALERIGNEHIGIRDECVSVLLQQLEKHAENDPSLNGFLINYLIHLQAVEAAPTMEQAFISNNVDLLIMGDWEDAQMKLGLKVFREKPRRKLPNFFNLLYPTIENKSRSKHYQKRTNTPIEKIKSKRKQAENSRKKNRRKK